MKLLATLSVLLLTQGALAGENPQSVEATKTVELALVESNTNTSWSVEPIKFEATAHQTAELNKTVDQMNAKISANLDTLIAEKFEQSLAN